MLANQFLAAATVPQLQLPCTQATQRPGLPVQRFHLKAGESEQLREAVSCTAVSEELSALVAAR